MDNAVTIANSVRVSLASLYSPEATPECIKRSERALLNVTGTLKGLHPLISLEVVSLLLRPLLSPSIETRSNISWALAEFNHGFYVLDEVLFRANSSWASFSDDVRSSVRTLAVELFRNASEVNPNGSRTHGFPSLVLEKIISLLSALAIREWPQRWPTFLEELFSDGKRAETCCHVLRVMSEEVYDYGTYIESERREELIHALALTLPQTLVFITSAANFFNQQKNYKGLNTALDTIHAFLSWASLDEVFSAHVPDACFLLLRLPETRNRALSAITKLVQRNFSQAGQAVDRKQGAELKAQSTGAQFRDTVFYGLLKYAMESRIHMIAKVSLFPPTRAIVPVLADSYAMLVSDPKKQDITDEEEHEFQVMFFNMLSDMGCTNFCDGYLFSKQRKARSLSAEEQQCAAGFVELMLCATACPSSTIRLAVVPFFTVCIASITRNIQALGGSLPSGHLAHFVVTGYLQSACLALISFPHDVDGMTRFYEELDFVDDSRREKDRFENLVSRTVSAMSAASKICPGLACSSSLNKIVALLSRRPVRRKDGDSVSKGVKSAKASGCIVPDGSVHGWVYGHFSDSFWSAWECCLSATITATEAAITGANAAVVGVHENRRDEMNELMQKSFQLAMSITEEAIFPHKSHILRILFPLYAVKPQLLQPTFAELISQGTNLPGKCRYRACLAVSVLCKRLTSIGVVQVGQFKRAMCNYTAEAIPDRFFGLRNKVHLMEASISIILASGSFLEQQEFIEQLMDLILNELESENVKSTIRNPATLVQFVSTGDRSLLAQLVEAFQLMESSTHQIARPTSKMTGPIALPSVLSRTIAPRCVESAGALIRAVHGMYNSMKFPLDDDTETHQQLLLPTSREITTLLNLENSSRFRREHIDERSKTGEDTQEGSVGEQLSSQILLQYAIQPPDPRLSHARETLKSLRKSAYEMVRSAIFSGVTNSDAHLENLIAALTEDCYHLEPIHLVELTGKILRPLMSYSVMSAGSMYFNVLERSRLPALLNVIQEHIESTELGEIVDTTSAVLDIARDYGRKSLARSVVDLLCDMYPRNVSAKGVASVQLEVYVPPVLDFPIVGSRIKSLWRVICSPGPGVLDSTTPNMGFKLVTDSTTRAPAHRFDIYGPLLEASFRTSLENRGLKGDSPFDQATGAMLAIMRKWPMESKSVLEAISHGQEQVSRYISECIESIVQSSQHHAKPKKHKIYITEMIKKIAEFSGVDSRPIIKVTSLPEKLITNNPARSANKPRHELEEIVLGDAALDSLFGDGNPL